MDNSVEVMFYEEAICRTERFIQNIAYNMFKIHCVDWDLHGLVILLEHSHIDLVILILDYVFFFVIFGEKTQSVVLLKSFNLNLQITFSTCLALCPSNKIKVC